MHLAQRLVAIILTLGLSAGLASCGFHLKGAQSNAAPLVYRELQLQLPEEAENLEDRLKVYLGASGAKVTNSNNAYVLRVIEYTPRRQLLNGKLTEVLLRLTVTFQIEDQQGHKITEPRTLTASRSYQYDLETVNTENQQESYLRGIVIDDIAQQITRQLSANRLPKAQQ